jgi:hypothetical protein
MLFRISYLPKHMLYSLSKPTSHDSTVSERLNSLSEGGIKIIDMGAKAISEIRSCVKYLDHYLVILALIH